MCVADVSDWETEKRQGKRERGGVRERTVWELRTSADSDQCRESGNADNAITKRQRSFTQQALRFRTTARFILLEHEEYVLLGMIVFVVVLFVCLFVLYCNFVTWYICVVLSSFLRLLSSQDEMAFCAQFFSKGVFMAWPSFVLPVLSEDMVVLFIASLVY